ncbi:MAG: 2-C-methyl-D-erythritol 2,4-cyclodiphosphate synthase [Aquidulcibacter sp.]|nr:2-C-methyl-D-erythritol 2,4-cyclodiphosphate synthase [Aquidulcibacter sp.]
MAVAILVAGGTGTRAKQAAAKAGSSGQIDLPKQFQSLGGKPILRWSLEAFSRDPRFGAIVVVCAPEMRERVLACAGSIPVRLADAGQTRTQSVASGLQAAAAIGGSFCFIHDAARPGLSQTVLDHLFLALEAGADGAAPGLPIADALWLAPDGQVQQTQARDGLVRIQTPQAFRANLIQAAYAALPADQVPLDDVAVAKAFGANVQVVAGSPLLEKITWPEDFDRMTRLLAPQLLPRIGSGFDAHKFAEGTFVTLCGVEVPHSHGLAGHSDADVAWHCLADAIYGALSAGDIGRHFPPTDPQWRGAASSIFLAHAGEMVRAAGGSINHIDLTIICERPKIGPHREAMVRKTAELLGLRESQVSVKATTTEGMGFTGRAEGIAAQATATILLPADFGTALT